MDQTQITRFTNLWTQSQNSVFAVICSSITNFDDAEDVLQKVSTVAVSKFENFERDGDVRAFTGWSIAIARFEILRYLRDRGTDRHEYVAESIGHVAQAFEDISPEFDDRRHALAHCRQLLTGRTRDVLEQRYGEGNKTGVIAQRMGLKPGNVSVILNRAYRKLRDCVDGRLAAGSDRS